MEHYFERFTTGCARFAGRPLMLGICILLCLTGLAAYLSGDPLFLAGTSMGISALTLLLLPVLQATQNRDGAALQAKMDELIKASANARNELIGLENRREDEIERIRVNESNEVAAAKARAPAKKRAG
jgi:low affinity Fe/Cu permease